VSDLSSSIEIDGRKIGPGEPPYIIAELSANHGGSLTRALAIIEGAAAAGVDAVKFQAYTPESMTIATDKPGFVIEGDNPWKGRQLYDLYAEAATPYDWFPDLYAHARKLGITPFTTPFGADAIPMLEELDNPVYKIASFEAVDAELIKACTRTGKPLLISTGMCSKEDIGRSLDAVRAQGGDQVAIFRCNSGYPANLDEANLLAMPDMAESFAVPVGYSDHTIGHAAAIAACALGANMIEKHVIDTIDPPTPDSSFSMLLDDFGDFVGLCHQAYRARGQVLYGPFENERGSLSFRRSLYAVTDIAAGAEIRPQDIRSVRPGFGLHPRHLDEIIGRKTAVAVERGDPITWDIFG